MAQDRLAAMVSPAAKVTPSMIIAAATADTM